MPYEHKSTEAVDVPTSRWFTIRPTDDLVPEWDFGADDDLDDRSYDFERGDRRFVQHVSEQEVAVAMVKYVNTKVQGDQRKRLLRKTEDGFNTIWTLLEP